MNQKLTTLITAAALSLAVGCASAQSVTPQPNPNWRGMAQLEQIGIREGLTVTEIESKQRLAEVEGYDAESRKVKLVIDRQTGEILSRRVKDRRYHR